VAWLLLAGASICEIVFAIAMKQSQGFTKLVPSLIVFAGGVGGVVLLTLALKTLPVSIGYPIWTGIGMVGTVLLGAFMLGEGLTVAKVIGVVLLIAGVVTLYSQNA
jgi:quaternary ammonium compound-resistance protein SugE